MRSVDYVTEGGDLDVKQFQADFACASLVGTRGYGIEKGLGAAVAAVSPELTEGPNAGFLREDARFALMFVTDENDCTHDGTLDETTACGGDMCEYWNQENRLGGPLTPVTELKAQLLGNLSQSKGREVFEEEVFVGSIHGQAARYAGERPAAAQCELDDYEGIAPSCASPLGVAYSGDRYERFIVQFPHFFPEVEDERASMIGWMCRGDFSPAIEAVGDWIGAAINPADR